MNGRSISNVQRRTSNNPLTCESLKPATRNTQRAINIANPTNVTQRNVTLWFLPSYSLP